MDFKKTWEELQIRNDFLFARVMRDKKICIALLETLLKTKITDIEYLEEQKTVDIDLDAKSIRLDVYVENEERAFDLEMQTTNKKDLPFRSRYYQGLIDLNTIEKGESYKRLKESYILFICTFDPFGQNRAQYTFENLCVEDKELSLNDGTKKIFFNTTAYKEAEDTDVREFLKYVNGGESDHPFVKTIKDKVEQVKSNKEWRLEYMTLYMREQEIREETWEEAWKKSEEETRKETREKDINILIESLKSFNIPIQAILEQIMERYGLTKDEADSFINQK